MATKGQSVLFICADIPVELEEGFNDWYTREHLPERANGVPGFNRGRRFEALYDTPRYLAIYETDGPEVLKSEPYLALVRNFDQKSRQYVPNFERVSRTVLSLTATSGVGESGVIAILALRPLAGEEDRLRDYLRGLVEKELMRTNGIVATHFWERDGETLSASRQNHLRTGDRVLTWILAVEANRESEIRLLRRGCLAPEKLADAGMEEEELFGAFRLLYSITKGG